ncbi:MAG TPA: hypothetical protein DCG69_09065 [Bacteroidales bacterium]|nr:hypothetical protein [Bacteroidales bacterium]
MFEKEINFWSFEKTQIQSSGFGFLFFRTDQNDAQRVRCIKRRGMPVSLLSRVKLNLPPMAGMIKLDIKTVS